MHIGSDGQVQPVNFPVDAISAPDLPRSIRNYCTLSHNEVVCAVAISDPVKHIYTGGKVVPLTVDGFTKFNIMFTVFLFGAGLCEGMGLANGTEWQ